MEKGGEVFGGGGSALRDLKEVCTNVRKRDQVGCFDSSEDKITEA